MNELTNVSRSGTLTVAGTTTSGASSVTVNSLAADRYSDGSFARAGFTLADGNNNFTAVAQDSYGRSSTDSISVNLPASSVLAYDLNGNLTNDGLRTFEYDYENQLTNIFVPSAWRSAFQYDSFGRRRVCREYTWSGTWVLTNEVHYVYDGLLVVQERDANNRPLVSYTRGRDLSGTLQGAGGIGGLLARTDNSALNAGLSTAHAYYHADGNGNITCLVDTNGAVVARYSYDPFGNILSMSGPLAEANLYRFSSKEWHANSGLWHFLYRDYAPGLQRWIRLDPILEEGDVNLFRYVYNSPTCFADPFGLKPGDTFPTAEAAAKDACKYIYPKTKADAVEYGGWVENLGKGRFSYKEPVKGDAGEVVMPPKPKDAAAMFHSHPKMIGAEYFSGSNESILNWPIRRLKAGDTFTADRQRCPSYLVTPKGKIKRYDPDPKIGGNGKISTVGTVQDK